MQQLSYDWPWTKSSPRLGFIGLGNMGAALAMRLVGQPLSVFDNDPAKCDVFASKGVDVAGSLAELATNSDIIFTCLPTSAITETVLFGPDGLSSHLSSHHIIVDMTSGDPAQSRDQAGRLADADICFADAPVSGGPRGARDGVIAIMVGGAVPLYNVLHPVLSVISCNIFHAGDVGAGHALKAGNNLLNLICRMATFEVVSLLVNAGVAPDKAVDILQKSSGRNYATEITLPDNILSGKMHQGFSMALMQKDAGLALSMAANLKQAMPLGDTALNALQTAIDAHGIDADMSLVALSYEDATGARIRP
ncbi:MAG: NAD(P)-dependent oxidoreductase [Proteobacteria bacterium]|nr:NAD(P)-dependent oxidoreductase [Pseudomonadota bacterium]MDA0844949.1 NAD(P)-dependent oxidoreductase [Pseudomonadota bacterium]